MCVKFTAMASLCQFRKLQPGLCDGKHNRTMIKSDGGPVNLTVSAVPEPATWAMMLLGFGLVGAAIRRMHTKQKGRVVGVYLPKAGAFS
jgi:PEP-CTERM motif